MIADRHPVVRFALRHALQRSGIAVTAEAFDYGSMIDELRDFGGQAVLLDADLPPAGGISVLRDLQNVAKPIVVFAMHPNPTLERHAKRQGATAFLPKHVPIRQLVNTIQGIASNA